jgi:hypothetical protein
MVIAPATAQIFDLSKVAYLKDKTHDEISAAAAVEQPSHAEMVKLVTGFIDKLIQSGVDKLETAASNGSDTEAKTTAQINLEAYNRNQGSVTSFKGEIASDLAKNIYAVKQFLIEGGLAEHKDNQELTFKTKDSVDGSKIAAESAKELAHQALELVNERLSAYGINVDTPQVTQLQTEIIQELKKPPELKSEAATVSEIETTEIQTPNESRANPQELLTQFTKFITEISNLTSVKTLLKQNNGLEVLSKLNQDLADLNPIVKGEASLPAALEKAFKALDEKAHSKNEAFINNYLANPEKFKQEFNTLLDDNQKLQIQMTLINIEGQAKQTKTINNIASSIAEIKSGLGGDRLAALLSELSSVNKGHTTLSKENHLDTIDNLLEGFKKDLEPTSTANREDRIAIRDEATKAFIQKLNTGLKDESLSNADIKLIAQRLEKPNQEGDSGKNAKEIAEQVLENSIKNLNISQTELQKFGGLAVAAVVGLMIFCPNAIGNLFKGGAGLVAMAAPQITPLLAAKMMMQTNQKGVSTQLTQILEQVGIKN